ncbi:chorismate--pyruvate lyase family protein [Brumicola pallidula]|jgi:chorismate--pyruvate lyase|uniref:Probable chorismate pyruvate-lyase n=1 Tax=Brumicola pallidula DSM 14239 = ACAM 615 TaxID=1121922 RepID=K6ZUF1_9ALTE|nr:chorismate lyase [Glaciecola pallidula]GAC26960.1 chorismate--pyruvate lyase [Glaciecola pallidula DSM 14239 = ACAM 615]
MLVPLEKNNTDADIIFAVLDLLYRIKLNFLNHLSQINQFPLGIHASWKSASQYDIPNQHLADWLLHTGSLTERLQALTNKFEVKVLGQATIDADQSEQVALIDYHKHQWQIREVILYGDGKPWVFARSVLPEHLCKTTWATLGNQPLGQRIFNDNKFVRSEFVIAQLDNNPIAGLGTDPPIPAATNALWGRRSAFKIEAWHLLVAEVFLPDCPSYICDTAAGKISNVSVE